MIIYDPNGIKIIRAIACFSGANRNYDLISCNGPALQLAHLRYLLSESEAPGLLPLCREKHRGHVFILDNLVSRPASPPLRHKDGGQEKWREGVQIFPFDIFRDQTWLLPQSPRHLKSLAKP